MTTTEINAIIELMAKKYLTTGEVSKLLEISKQWVSTLCRDGAFESYRLSQGGWHRISRKSFEEYLELHSIDVDWGILNDK